MNLHGTLTRPSTPTYPNPPQKYYSNTKNRVLSNENIFHTRLKEPITWHAHLTHLNKKSRPLWIQICYFFSKLKRVLTKNINQSFFVKRLHFSIFYNIFSYSQQAFFLIFWEIFVSFAAILLLFAFLFFRKSLIRLACFFRSLSLLFKYLAANE